MNIRALFSVLLMCVFMVACSGDDDPRVRVNISPTTASVVTGGTQTFTASVTGTSNRAVTWSVEESGGGSISASGVYTAPMTAGTYTVVATSEADDRRSASATVTVTAPPPENAMVRVFHASSNAPKVNIWVNGEVAAEMVDYQESTGYLTVPEDTYEIAVEGIIPGGNAVVIGPVDLEFMGSTDYDIIAVNSVDAIEPLVLSDTGSLSDESMVRVRVAHLAYAAPEVKVFVTAPDAEIAGTEPLGSFMFKDTLGPVEVAAGDYRIRVTLMDDTLVYDSGTVSLAAGKDLLIGAVPNVGTGDSPIELAVLDGGEVAILSDASAGADLRVVHASADAPAVDVTANDGDTPAITNLAFPDTTNYLNLPAGDYNFKVTPNAASEPVVIDADLALANGAAYTLLAVGALADIEPLVLTDDNRSVATEAKVRLVHGSTLAGNVDIYVLPEGTPIGTNAPAFADVPFKADTGYVSLAAGAYDVIITPAGMPETQAIMTTLDLEAGGVYTAVARDGAGLTTPLDVIALDGLAPMQAMVRVFHASADAPMVNLWVDGAVAVEELDYQESTGYLALDEGTYEIAVEGIIPGGNAVVIGPANLDFMTDMNYDVIAVNTVADIEPLVLEDDGKLMDGSKVRVRVAHLAAAAP